MSYIAIFDIGTTAVKGILVNKEAELTQEHSVELETQVTDRMVEQRPSDWWEAVLEIASLWWNNGVDASSVKAITFSGQMEDVITISNDTSYQAILYSDSRAAKEAEELKKDLPRIRSITGNNITGTTPLAKLKWMQAHAKEQYNAANSFVFSSKDYVIYKLTNATVTDPVTAATTGMMDLKQKSWNDTVLQTCGIDPAKMPELADIDHVIGNVSEEASVASGFSTSTLIINGSGDAGSTTLGASAINEKDGYFYMGTTGWLAVLEKNAGSLDALSEGHFNLGFLKEHRISVAPLLNVGNVHQWAIQAFIDSESAEKYAAFENLIKDAAPGCNGVLFLPYLNGERNPAIDPNAKGAYWGINPNTARNDMARAALEGVTFSLRQTLDMYNIEDQRTLTLIGGASKSNIWCQIIADIINHPIRVPVNSEYLPSLGIAATAFMALKWCDSYEHFINTHVKTVPCNHYLPNEKNVSLYEHNYQTFKKMHPAMQNIYS